MHHVFALFVDELCQLGSEYVEDYLTSQPKTNWHPKWVQWYSVNQIMHTQKSNPACEFHIDEAGTLITNSLHHLYCVKKKEVCSDAVWKFC